MKPLRFWLAIVAALPISLAAQDRLRTLPGYARAQRVAAEAGNAVHGGAPSATWIDAGTVEYIRDGKTYRYVLASQETTAIEADAGGAHRSGDARLSTAPRGAAGAGPT